MRTTGRDALIALAVLAVLAAVPLVAEDEPDIDPLARHMLKLMSRTLMQSTELTFSIQSSIDVVDDAGLMVQYNETLNGALRRPDRLMVRTRGDMGRRGFTYDGKTATIYYESYSSAEVPATIDAALDTLDEQYDFGFAVDDFMSSDPYESLLSGVTAGDYLGITDIDGVPCHHLVFREGDMDWQIWIEDSAWNLPRKFIVTYRQMEGWPQFTAYFTGWNQRVSLSDGIFQFDPPEIARKIRFMSREGR